MTRDYILVGFMIGGATVFLLAGVVVMGNGGILASAQADYTRCVNDGAPAEKCAATYLLPKEAKP